MKIRIINVYSKIWDEIRNILINHQRLENECSCGWDSLGASYADHLTIEINRLLVSHIEEVEIYD